MLQNRLRSRTGRKHAENVLDGDAHAADDRLAAEDFWVDRDALEEIGFVHDSTRSDALPNCQSATISVYASHEQPRRFAAPWLSSIPRYTPASSHSQKHYG